MLQKHDQSKIFNIKSTWTNISLLLICISIMVGYRTTNVSNLVLKTHYPLSPENQSISISEYTLVDPIEINNAEDWANYTFISGSGTQEEPFIIEGIEIAGNDSDYENYPDYQGISISDMNAWVIIQDCYIHHFHIGIKMWSFNENCNQRIEHNIIKNCGLGIWAYTGNVTIYNNQISDCHSMDSNLMKTIFSLDYDNIYQYGGAGICAIGSSGMNITTNIISNCDVGLTCQFPCAITYNQFIGCGLLADRMARSTIENNSVNGLPLGFFTYWNYNQTEGESLVLDGNSQQYGQLIILALNNVEIKNMKIRNTTVGYDIEMIQNLTIRDCTADNCLFGMYVRDLHIEEIPKIIDIERIHISNCLIGSQFNMPKSHVDHPNYKVFIDIAEFSNNQIDIFMAFNPSSWDSLTVPVRTNVYIDYYKDYQNRLQVSYNGILLNQTDSQLENVSSFFDIDEEEFNATILHLNHIGQYHILFEILNKNEWVALWNETINVVEIPIEKTAIGAFNGLSFSTALGLGVGFILIKIRKRKPLIYKI